MIDIAGKQVGDVIAINRRPRNRESLGMRLSAPEQRGVCPVALATRPRNSRHIHDKAIADRLTFDGPP